MMTILVWVIFCEYERGYFSNSVTSTGSMRTSAFRQRQSAAEDLRDRMSFISVSSFWGLFNPARYRHHVRTGSDRTPQLDLGWEAFGDAFLHQRLDVAGLQKAFV
jgi:hypothetical protein